MLSESNLSAEKQQFSHLVLVVRGLNMNGLWVYSATCLQLTLYTSKILCKQNKKLGHGLRRGSHYVLISGCVQ